MRALLLVLVACGGPHDAPTPTSIVTLRDPGAAPQHAVQYASHAATRRVQVSAGDARAPNTMAFVVDVEVAAGTSPIRARFRGVDALVPHRGSGSATADPDIGGFVRHVAGSLASDGHGRATANADSDHVWTTPSIPNALSMAIVPLPTEPIGRGARWHVAGADPGLGVSDAELDYEATALDTDGATVRWTGNVHKDGLAIQLEGTATVRFTELLPAHTTIVQHVPPQPGGIPALDFVITIE